MKAPTSAFFDKARELLAQAGTMYGVGLYEPAGRTAYLAGFHAAQALLFETSERSFKTHDGVNRELHRLLRNDPRVSDDVRAFLGRAYRLKEIADYLTGPGARVSPEMAREAMDSAKRFVECIVGLIPASPEPDRAQ